MRFTTFVLFGVLAAFSLAAKADSLWTSAGNGSLFTDKKARQVGDQVTILVVETSSASQNAKTSVSKKSSVDVKPGVGPLLKNIPKFGFDGDTSSSADGSTSRTTALTARITATVMEVKPNGDLVLSGCRNVVTNNETQILRINGVVRGTDISPENTVLSTYLADAKIEYTGKGPIAERQKPGIITRIFKLIF